MYTVIRLSVSVLWWCGGIAELVFLLVRVFVVLPVETSSEIFSFCKEMSCPFYFSRTIARQCLCLIINAFCIHVVEPDHVSNNSVGS